ncbi:MAG: hypothetical protein GY822_20340 [Deltaproteobacteria bacterium]|nr:hypothetical protein [Deltaproteobacteria bacterium]
MTPNNYIQKDALQTQSSTFDLSSAFSDSSAAFDDISVLASAPLRESKSRVSTATLSVGLFVGALLLTSCSDGESANVDGGNALVQVSPDGEPDGEPKAKPRFDGPSFSPSKASNPVHELQGVIGGTSSGYCVQFRSVKGLAAAEVLKERIESEAGLNVALLKADLGKRGLWYRVCAGNERSAKAADKKARGWTAAGGKLSPFMEPVAPGQAAFFVKKRPANHPRQPTVAQARLLLAAHPDGSRPVQLLLQEKKGVFLGAVSTLPQGRFGASVLVVDDKGREVPLVSTSKKLDCKACDVAFVESKIIRRVLIDGFNTGPWPGDELLVEEGTEAGASVLSVYRQKAHKDGRISLVREAAMWLGAQEPRLQLLAQAKAVEADGDADKEIAVITTELPLLNGRLCGLRRRAEIFDLTPRQPRRLGPSYASAMARAAKVAGGAGAVRLMARAYDQSRDYLTGSRVCAAFLSSNPEPGLAQHCIGRIEHLLKAGRKIEAVNAAGALAEANPALRPAIAGPFYHAVKALDTDPRLTVHDDDCMENPLLEDFDKRPVGQAIRMAKARAKDRMNLAEVADTVFVTGVRDFGPKTPVGRMVQGWLDRLKVALPARYSAIEALLITAPPKTTPTPTPPAPEPKKGRPPIIIQVHDEPELP